MNSKEINQSKQKMKDMKNKGKIVKNEDDLKINDHNLKYFIDNSLEIKSENLKTLLELIQLNMDNGYFYLIGFLNIDQNLIELYIKSELDEKEGEYYKIFEELKKHVFINRNCLNPIYEYFSDILYNIDNNYNEIKEKFLKFPKVQRLWKLFYDIPKYSEEIKYLPSSLIYFNGGNLKLIPSKRNYEEDIFNNLEIQIFLIPSFQNKINKNFQLIINKTDGKKLSVKYNKIYKKQEATSNILKINIKNNQTTIQYNEEKYCIKNLESKEIKEIILLDNFYGEIYKIFLLIINKKLFLSFNGLLKPSDEKGPFKIEFSKKCKTNFVNYLDNENNIYEYFGGLKPFIPFVSLINGIYKNKQIEYIGEIQKNIYLQNFILDIFNVLEQYCLKLKGKKIIKKLDDKNVYNINITKNRPKIIDKSGKKVIFFLYLLFQIDSSIIPKDITTLINNIINDKEDDSNINKNPFKEIKLFVKNNELKSVIESFKSIYQMDTDNIINEKINETNNNNIFFNEINKKNYFLVNLI